MRVLLVEDEPKMARILKMGLEEENYAVDWAPDGEEGLYLAEVNQYDAIILDRMLPGKDGTQISRTLRQKNNNVPILMLTARDSLQDVVSGLDSGADDYLTKPFAFAELYARLRSLLRRGKGETSVLKCADLTYHVATRKVMRDGKELTLTPKELALLDYLLRHQDQVVSRAMLAEHVWDDNFDTLTNIIDVHINHLRNKIDRDFPVKLIQTVRGLGYIMKGDQDA